MTHEALQREKAAVPPASAVPGPSPEVSAARARVLELEIEIANATLAAGKAEAARAAATIEKRAIELMTTEKGAQIAQLKQDVACLSEQSKQSSVPSELACASSEVAQLQTQVRSLEQNLARAEAWAVQKEQEASELLAARAGSTQDHPEVLELSQQLKREREKAGRAEQQLAQKMAGLAEAVRVGLELQSRVELLNEKLVAESQRCDRMMVSTSQIEKLLAALNPQAGEQ